MKKLTPVTIAVVVFLSLASGAAEIARDDATRPIIAQLLSNPAAYANKPIMIYGLVIEKNPIRFSFYKMFLSSLLK